MNQHPVKPVHPELNEPSISVMNKVFNLGKAYHADQQYGEFPYEVHLYDVLSNAKTYSYLLPTEYACPHEDKVITGRSSVLLVALAASFLHDILEDTACTKNEIIKVGGEHHNVLGCAIMDVVDRVTLPEADTRKERFEKLYPYMRKSNLAVYVKLCDRISNVTTAYYGRHISEKSERMYKKYTKEYPEFRSQLRFAGEYDRMWLVLDDLLSSNG